MAAEFGRDLVEHPLAAGDTANQPHHAPVGLILRNERSSTGAPAPGPSGSPG